MIVTREAFFDVVDSISLMSGPLAFDTETYGLRYDDKCFSISVATLTGSYYFNFNKEPDHLGVYPDADTILPREWIVQLNPIFKNRRCYAHNAKFDLHKLVLDGLDIVEPIYDTLSLAVIWNNSWMRYDLDSLCQRFFGTGKDDVKEYMQVHKLYSMRESEYKDKDEKNFHFDLVPTAIMAEYAEKDAALTLRLGEFLTELLKEYDEEQKNIDPDRPSIFNVVENEAKLVHVLRRMESRGVVLDREYCTRAADNCKRQKEHWEQVFMDRSKLSYDNKRNTLASALENAGANVSVNAETGNTVMDKGALSSMDNPIAECIREIRRYTTEHQLYTNYLEYADKQDILHPNYNGSRDSEKYGARTGRLSCSEPNLQNIKKDSKEEGADSARSCFIPRPGFFFLKIDYDQQEYKMMLDYANQADMIKDVNNGKDLHQSTADMMGSTRQEAKTLNFTILYGAGITKISGMLGIKDYETKLLKARYFANLPMVKRFIYGVRAKGEKSLCVFSWFGRRLRVAESRLAYRLSNHIIQGGCADVVKVAMVKLDQLLEPYQTRMVLQIHDEIVFEMPESEMHLIPQIKEIMETVYQPKNGLPLTVSVSINKKSLSKKDDEAWTTK